MIRYKFEQMKELKFITPKGDFLLLDGKETITERLAELLKEYDHYAVVKEMTEEQFCEVLDSSIHTSLFAHYVKDVPVNIYCYKSGMESLSSLVRSLGWYLWENPVQVSIASMPATEQAYRQLDADWQEAESKTLYSPILLKKI